MEVHFQKIAKVEQNVLLLFAPFGMWIFCVNRHKRMAISVHKPSSKQLDSLSITASPRERAIVQASQKMNAKQDILLAFL